jgi:outer membrane protein assembly factor BamB
MSRATTTWGSPTLLTVLVTGVLLAGCGLNVDVDRTEAESPPKPLADRGPAPGTYKQAWQVAASSGKRPASYRLVAGNLLAATKTGVYAHDAHTGKPTWHYSEPGRQVWSIAESDGAIVVHTYENVHEDGSDHIRDEHLVGVDAGTGEELWESTKEWSILTGGRTGSNTPPTWGDAADGVVSVQAESPFERAGVEARTGKKLWQVSDHDVAEACTDKTGTASTGPILVTPLSCGMPDDVIVALDARSGELRWRRALAAGAAGEQHAERPDDHAGRRDAVGRD